MTTYKRYRPLQIPDLLHKPRPLKFNPKKPQQKYLVLLSNQRVFIDTEWEAMKSAVKECRATGARIIEMLPTESHKIKITTDLSTLLENLEREKQLA